MKVKNGFDAIGFAPWVSGVGFAILSVILCLLASGVAGRALWCDEILRINGQSMSVAQLMRFEHLRSADPGREWHLGIDLLSYMNTAIEAKIGSRALGGSHVVRKTAAESLFIPQRKGLPGLPSPDDWVRMGHQFAIAAPPESLTLPLGVLAPGWHEVSLDGGRKAAPLILTAHGVGASPPR